jgi:hypothetical protein
MKEKLKKQLESIRASGLTNMVDVNRVQFLAFERKYDELFNWLSDHKKEHFHLFLTGEWPDGDD